MDEPGDTADQDDPAPGLLQGVDRRPDQQRWPEHVGQHHLGPARRVAVGDRIVGGEPGVRDDHVQPPELPQRGRDGGAYVVVLGRVPLNRQQALGAAEFHGESAQPLLAPAGDDDPMAGIEQLPRDGGADTAAAPGDECDG
ncbi:hypothetical protein QFZ49_006927 [Streptomyces turgidiscabies]|uniref:Uncharacterized protein n=1 Tax=Streptomyces turgidiscabies TaxID=85558 RepID=A0ABU0RY97_9ACTN|nr:hypothetical protein [Streptomyces turgidiscabies]